ncbi:MAG TPA: MFS transporter [Gemmatimonadaceae bacterium]|nr:MFS transporter [Gemmatimonadaceae bacterium]
MHLLGALRAPGHPGFVEATVVSGSRVFASGAIFAALALALGGGHLSIAAIAAIPFLSRLAHLLVPALLRRCESWRVALAAAWLERLGLLAAALAGIVRPDGWAIPGFLAGLAVALLGQAVYDVALASLHSESTAAKGFGRYTATKTRWAAVSGLVLGVVASFAVDATERLGVPPHIARSLAIVAGAAIHLAIARPLAGMQVFARRQAARADRAAARASVVSVTPVDERAFRSMPWGVVRFAVAWGFALGISTRQGEAMAISVLDLSVGSLTLLNALLVGGGVLGAKMWGVLADRFGGKGLMSIALGVIALDPLWMLAAMLVHPLLLIPSYAIYGVFNSGWNIATTMTLIRTAGPPAERIRSLIVYSVAFGVAAGTAPLLGGLLLELVDARFPTTVAYGSLFVLAAILRLSAYPLLRLMPAPPARRGRYVSTVVLRAMRRDARRRGVASWASAARDVARIADRRSA